MRSGPGRKTRQLRPLIERLEAGGIDPELA